MLVTFVENGCNMTLASNIIATHILSFLNMGTELEYFQFYFLQLTPAASIAMWFINTATMQVMTM